MKKCIQNKDNNSSLKLFKGIQKKKNVPMSCLGQGRPCVQASRCVSTGLS